VSGKPEPAIRPESDPATLAAIHGACFADDPWTAEAFSTLLASPGCFALVAQARSGGKAAGMILARVAGEDCEIITIGVLPGHRRHGLAILLLEHAGARAVGLGARRQVLEVAIGNAAALGLYARLGFAECGRRPGYYGGEGGDAVILARAIG